MLADIDYKCFKSKQCAQIDVFSNIMCLKIKYSEYDILRREAQIAVKVLVEWEYQKAVLECGFLVLGSL